MSEAKWSDAKDLHLSASQIRFDLTGFDLDSMPAAHQIKYLHIILFFTEQILFPCEVLNSFSGYSLHTPDALLNIVYW
jgi:hypothetical protein